MLTPREVAAAKYQATRGMSRRVLGFSAEQNEQLRVWRVEQLATTLVLLRAALASPRFLASQWDDDALTAAITVVERQHALEVEQLAVTS